MPEWISKLLLGLGTKALALYLAKVTGRLEVLREIAENNAEKQKEYSKIAAEHRTVKQLLDRLQDGSF